MARARAHEPQGLGHRCAAFWLLLSHPIALEDGTRVAAWRLIEQQLARIDAATFWTFVGLATGIKMIGMLSSMYRWLLVLRGQGIELPFRHIFGSFLIGRAIGTFLPSTAGLDGYTLYDASRFSGLTVEVTAAKFLEKVCGFSGVFLTFLVSLPFGIAIFGDNARLFAGRLDPARARRDRRPAAGALVPGRRAVAARPPADPRQGIASRAS